MESANRKHPEGRDRKADKAAVAAMRAQALEIDPTVSL
jgi:hypothetical protein